MARILRPASAFSKDPSGKHMKRMVDQPHLAFIRTLPCLVTGKLGVEAAHIRMASELHRKPSTGKSQKPSDCWVVPLAPDVHRKQHSGSEVQFWDHVGIDPCEVAAALYEVTGDRDEAIKIIQSYKAGGSK
jgi:hypothetical protein